MVCNRVKVGETSVVDIEAVDMVGEGRRECLMSGYLIFLQNEWMFAFPTQHIPKGVTMKLAGGCLCPVGSGLISRLMP